MPPRAISPAPYSSLPFAPKSPSDSRSTPPPSPQPNTIAETLHPMPSALSSSLPTNSHKPALATTAVPAASLRPYGHSHASPSKSRADPHRKRYPHPLFANRIRPPAPFPRPHSARRQTNPSPLTARSLARRPSPPTRDRDRY